MLATTATYAQKLPPETDSGRSHQHVWNWLQRVHHLFPGIESECQTRVADSHPAQNEYPARVRSGCRRPDHSMRHGANHRPPVHHRVVGLDRGHVRICYEVFVATDSVHSIVQNCTSGIVPCAIHRCSVTPHVVLWDVQLSGLKAKPAPLALQPSTDQQRARDRGPAEPTTWLAQPHALTPAASHDVKHLHGREVLSTNAAPDGVRVPSATRIGE
mmetsp:Transcript_29620/g.78455  ORF Transcript_29620/g.78455 Transcript_29620/m.78455 type:complete len:215 (+) Transcript_29620:218-862(+)